MQELMRKHYEQLARATITQLRRRGFEAEWFATAEEAKAAALRLLPEGRTAPAGAALRLVSDERQCHLGGRGAGEHRRHRQPSGGALLRAEAGAGTVQCRQDPVHHRNSGEPGPEHRRPSQRPAVRWKGPLCRGRPLPQLPEPGLHLQPDSAHPGLPPCRTHPRLSHR